jgi:hypothetical protein
MTSIEFGRVATVLGRPWVARFRQRSKKDSSATDSQDKGSKYNGVA